MKVVRYLRIREYYGIVAISSTAGTASRNSRAAR